MTPFAAPPPFPLPQPPSVAVPSPNVATQRPLLASLTRKIQLPRYLLFMPVPTVNGQVGVTVLAGLLLHTSISSSRNASLVTPGLYILMEVFVPPQLFQHSPPT